MLLVKLLLAFPGGWVGFLVVRAFGWPYWAYHVFVLSMAIVLRFVGGFLANHYIEAFIEGAPLVLRVQLNLLDEMEAAQKAVRMGAIPWWVRLVGILPTAFFWASPLELVARLVR